jgi:hypothetical protein
MAQRDYIATYTHATGTGRTTRTKVIPATSIEEAGRIAIKTLAHIPGIQIESVRKHRTA